MRGGWSVALRDFVQAVDSVAALIAEVVILEDSHIISTRSQWEAGTSTGSLEHLDSGGILLLGSPGSLVSHTDEDDGVFTDLSMGPAFGALRIDWLGVEAPNRVFSTLTARLDPRADPGEPKTVAHFIAEVYQIYHYVDYEGFESDDFQAALIGRSQPVAATGETEADFAFQFEAFPWAGPPPTGGSSPGVPQTLIRIFGVQDDGSPADNMAWLGDVAQGGSKTDGSVYRAQTLAILQADLQMPVAGGIWTRTLTNGPFPYFELDGVAYAEASKEFAGDAAVPDLPGSGRLRLVARGETPDDSSLTLEIDDGGGYVEFFDGDYIGEDNTPRGGADLSGVSTTGPWDLNATLTPSTGGLRTPVLRDVGIERLIETDLSGVAEFPKGSCIYQVMPEDLQPNIPAGQVHILKTGERDYRDYGSTLLSRYHIGQVELRMWVGDPTGLHLARNQWMLHSAWEIEDFWSEGDRHVVQVVSPLQRLKRRIPPFVITSGNNGTRTAAVVSGTLKGVFETLREDYALLPARYWGPGIENDTDTAANRIEDSYANTEIDAVAYLAGGCVTESQGRIAFKRVLRDNPATDVIRARYLRGTYRPVHIGPGFSVRTDEFFVRYNYEQSTKSFTNEKIFLNAIAKDRLGGRGLDTTGELESHISRWINSADIADAVGLRKVKHLANGMIVWELANCPRNPQLEIGDLVQVETDQFVCRSPITDSEIRGLVIATGMIVYVDPWAENVHVWVPGFDFIAVAIGTTTRRGFDESAMLHSDSTARSHTGDTALTSKQTFQVPALRQGGVFYEARVKGVFVLTGAGGTKDVSISYRGGVAHGSYAIPSGDQTVTVEAVFSSTGATGVLATFLEPLVPGIGGAGDSFVDVQTPADIDFNVQLANAGDAATLVFSEIEWRRAA